MHNTILLLALLLGSLTAWANPIEEKKDDLEPYVFESELLGNKYLKVINCDDPQNEHWSKTCIKIYEKSTDKLLQTLDSIYITKGVNDIMVGDYNFDGLCEFSIYDQQGAGTNTSRIYYLYEPKTGTFFESGFVGSSLEFDADTKRIYEHSQCCAGSSVMEAIYKVKNNEMVLVEQHCYELNLESTESEFGLEYTEVDCN